MRSALFQMIVIRFLQFLFVLLVVRLLGRLFSAAVRGGAPSSTPRRTKPVQGGELVRDRVCNTHLPRERALVARIGGREEYFCSAACRDAVLGAATRAS